MANRILLPNGCSMSNPSVNPKDWKSGGQTLLKKYWHIQYYFYDPSHPRQKKLVVVKNMNAFTTLPERRAATQTIIDDQIEQNRNGYNPLLGKYVIHEIDEDAILHAHLPFITAYRIAVKRLQVTEKHRTEIGWGVNRLEKAAIKLHMSSTTISELKRSELKRVMDKCGFTDFYYNKVRAYISSLYRELIEDECCETNLAHDIRKRKTISKEREVLNFEQLKIIMNYLKENYYEFYRYAFIFLYSGARTTELFNLQVKNVNLQNQEFKVLIKKGSRYKEATKVILKEAVPLWEELLIGAKPKDYVFSRGLEPGPEAIKPKQITRRWYNHVKKSNKILDENENPIKVSSDFYALKHAFLDSLSTEDAKQMASHDNARTTLIYQVNKNKRDREVLKEMDIKVI